LGISENSARFLLYEKKHGVSYSRTAMIGRQELFLSELQLKQNLHRFGDKILDSELPSLLSHEYRYAERFFERLGADTVHSYDNSSFENATHVHDFNTPIPESSKRKYTAIVDGGCLEHVFNIPMAMKNCMEMLEVGGSFLGLMPANNFFGHGFYQFSPELIFRIFSPENGFRMTHLFATEEFKRPKWYAVRDPDAIHERVVLRNRFPVYLFVSAKKVEERPIFEKSPQQSDYVARWNQEEQGGAKPQQMKDRIAGWLRSKVSTSMYVELIKWHQRFQYGFQKKFFQRFDPLRDQAYPFKY
jgi:hypothetical protein